MNPVRCAAQFLLYPHTITMTSCSHKCQPINPFQALNFNQLWIEEAEVFASVSRKVSTKDCIVHLLFPEYVLKYAREMHLRNNIALVRNQF